MECSSLHKYTNCLFPNKDIMLQLDLSMILQEQKTNEFELVYTELFLLLTILKVTANTFVS